MNRKKMYLVTKLISYEKHME